MDRRRIALVPSVGSTERWLMASSRRVRRIVSPIRKPASVQRPGLQRPKKWLVGSIAVSLDLALLLAWTFAPAHSTSKPSGTSDALVALTSLTGETADLSLPGPPSALAPADGSVPDAVGNRLPASVPAHTDELGARFHRVVDKKIANGQVTLTLKDEQTGELSIMTQPLGTNVDVQEGGGKERVTASNTPSVKPLDRVKSELTTH